MIKNISWYQFLMACFMDNTTGLSHLESLIFEGSQQLRDYPSF
jgi:hypothetical protein